jgi:hypothetical protein
MNEDKTKHIIEMMLLGQLMADRIDVAGAKGWLMQKVKMQSKALVSTLEKDMKIMYMATYKNEEASAAYEDALSAVESVFDELRSIPIESWESLADVIKSVKNKGE